MCYLHFQGNGIILADTKVIRERGGFGFVSKLQEMFPNVSYYGSDWQYSLKPTYTTDLLLPPNHFNITKEIPFQHTPLKCHTWHQNPEV
jgi:hypothetical protein